MRKYSRLVSLQEKKHKRSAFFWAFLSIFLFLGLIFWGIPTLAKISVLFSDLKNNGAVNIQKDNIVPGPPLFSNQEIATNSARLTLSGTAEAKAKVILDHNGRQKEINVNDDGSFSADIILLEGENTFTAKVRDEAGNESQESKKLAVIFDNTAPEIEIIEPKDGQAFQGSSEQIIPIKGKTNEDAQVTINGRLTTSLGENEFALQTKLTEGNNTFTIQAKDPAGNTTEKTLSISFFL